jgi:hypothetical protein
MRNSNTGSLERFHRNFWTLAMLISEGTACRGASGWGARGPGNGKTGWAWTTVEAA